MVMSTVWIFDLSSSSLRLKKSTVMDVVDGDSASLWVPGIRLTHSMEAFDGAWDGGIRWSIGWRHSMEHRMEAFDGA